MTTGPGLGGVHIPGIEALPKQDQRALEKAVQALLGDIFQTPSAGLQAKLDQSARMYPYLFVQTQVEARATVDSDPDAVEDPQDEDESPDIQGHDGDYREDPDHAGDEGSSAQSRTARSPDLRIRATGPAHAPRFEVELGPLPTSLTPVGGSRWPLPEWITQAIDERAARLLEVGRIITNRQRPFFTAASKDDALGLLVPLTRKQVASGIGFDDEIRFGRLIQDKTVETPRFDLVPLSIFFGGPRGKVPGAARMRQLRPESLAEFIRQIKQATRPFRWSHPKMRQELERRGILSQAKTPAAIEAANKRVARATKLIK